MTASPLLIDKKCEALQQALLALGEQAQRALYRSLEALREHDLAVARAIVDGDPDINRQRRVLEQEALLVLAAYQPAGADLRFVGASLETIAELERMADYAADIARILLRRPELSFPAALVGQVVEMGETALDMFRDAMAAYGRRGGDADGARAVAARDDRVDTLQREILDALLELIRQDCESAAAGVALVWIVHLYERVADRATNIAERVVFIATGELAELD